MIRKQAGKQPPVWSNTSLTDKGIEFCWNYSKFLHNDTYVNIIDTKPRNKWHNSLDLLNDVIAKEYSASRNERRIAMKRIFLFWNIMFMGVKPHWNWSFKQVSTIKILDFLLLYCIHKYFKTFGMLTYISSSTNREYFALLQYLVIQTNAISIFNELFQ